MGRLHGTGNLISLCEVQQLADGRDRVVVLVEQSLVPRLLEEFLFPVRAVAVRQEQALAEANGHHALDNHRRIDRVLRDETRRDLARVDAHGLYRKIYAMGRACFLEHDGQNQNSLRNPALDSARAHS